MLLSAVFGDGVRRGGGDLRHRRTAHFYIRGNTANEDIRHTAAETAAPAVQKMEKERAQAVSAQSVRQTTTPEGSDVFGSLFL